MLYEIIQKLFNADDPFVTLKTLAYDFLNYGPAIFRRA